MTRQKIALGTRVQVSDHAILFAGQVGTVMDLLPEKHPREVRVRFDVPSPIWGNRCKYNETELTVIS